MGAITVKWEGKNLREAFRGPYLWSGGQTGAQIRFLQGHSPSFVEVRRTNLFVAPRRIMGITV